MPVSGIRGRIQLNKYYGYQYKELWDDHAWDNRMSPLIPLTHWIGERNIARGRIPAKPGNERRKDGNYDPKANALSYPEILKYWLKKGLYYHCTSMALPWISMIPVEHLGKRNYHVEMDTVLVLTNSDHSDPSWCMYTLEKFREYLEAAARGKFTLLFVSSDSLDSDNLYITITQEAITLFHLNYERLFLDVSAVMQDGVSLKDIPGFRYTDPDGHLLPDPDDAVQQIGGIPVIDIAGRWINKDSLTYKSVKTDLNSRASFDRESVIHSETGRKLAEAMSLEYYYDDARDPRLLTHWESMGLRCSFHEKKGEQWIAFAPLGALGDRKEKIPCVCILQEVNRFDPHQAVTAFSFYHEYLAIAAQGACMLIFFALETPDDNDLLHDILEEAKFLYPLDSNKVYIVGQSHNGRFAAEYTRRHQWEVAGLGILNNEIGQLSPEVTGGFFQVSDEQLALEASVDTPIIIASGCEEKNCIFPLHSDASNFRPGVRIALDTFAKRAESWQRRLKSSRCPSKTIEEIAETKHSSDYVECRLGVPADRTDILFLDGHEVYVAEIKNNDGKFHFKVTAHEGMPHSITHSMIDISWSFLRRFARDPETKQIIDLL